MEEDIALRNLEETSTPSFVEAVRSCLSIGRLRGYTEHEMKTIFDVFLSYPDVMQFIYDLGGFTIFILREKFSLSQNQAYYTILVKLERVGLVHRVDSVKLNKRGSPSTVFLVEGADPSKVKEIKQLHVDLQPTGVIRPLFSFQTKQMATRIVDEVTENQPDGHIKQSTLMRAIREYNEVYDEDLWKRIQLEVKQRGRRIDYTV